MKKLSKFTTIVLMISVFGLFSCRSTSNLPISPTSPPLEQPVLSDEAVDTPKPDVPEDSQERVYVEKIQINIMESFPLQVSVTINGFLPDGCTSIIKSNSVFDGENNTFTIHIFTERPNDLDCTEALAPFSETVPLDVYGFSAGTYTVNAYQLTTTFKFESDNKITE